MTKGNGPGRGSGLLMQRWSGIVVVLLEGLGTNEGVKLRLLSQFGSLRGRDWRGAGLALQEPHAKCALGYPPCLPASQ